MGALGINLGFFLFQVLNFCILLVLLYAWAYKPIIKMLETRRLKIAQGLEDARIASEARANAEKEAHQIIAEAQAVAAQKVREATERADVAAREVLAQADAEAAQIRVSAAAEVSHERDRILSDVRGQIAALSMAAAQKLLGDVLDEQRHHTLIQEFFSGVKNGKVVVLEDEALSGGSAEITSALPLTPEEVELVKQIVIGKIGAQAAITFHVDPSILGGLVVRIGDKVLDGSVAGQLESLRQTLR
jgi:F-type H+-transporting ATPase subunit b